MERRRQVRLATCGTFAFALIGVLLWEALTQKTIAIASISVPRTLAENGYTAEVAAQRLRDALNKVLEDAHSIKNGPQVALQADLPSNVVPTMSLETVAADIRTFFRIANRWNISGELTMAQERLWLRLRMNGRDFYTSPNGVDQEHSDDLLAPAAEKIFEQANPIIAAESLKERNPGKSLKIARRIIADGPETQRVSAHNLAGNILLDQGKTDEAIAEYRKAIDLDPLYAWPHNNLGYALYGQHKTEEAIAEYRKAIGLDPGLTLARNNLGYALRDQHKTDEAIAEYRKAIERDPSLALPHKNLAIILRAQGKTKEADAEDWKANELGAKRAD